MLTFPKTTEVNRRIPKQKIYDAAQMNSASKRKFSEHVSELTWLASLSSATLNVSDDGGADEIEIIEIELACFSIDDAVLRQIAKAIPYKLLFVLKHDNKGMLAALHRKNGGDAPRIIRSDWREYDELAISISGLTVGAIWRNIIMSIDGSNWKPELTIEENLERQEQRAKLKKEIERLEKLVRAESQPRKKFELVQRINGLKLELQNED